MASPIAYFTSNHPGLLTRRTSAVHSAHVETPEHKDAMLIVFEGEGTLTLPTGTNVHTVSTYGAPSFDKEFPGAKLSYNMHRTSPVVVDLNGYQQAARVYAPTFHDYGTPSVVVIEADGACALLVEGIDQPPAEPAQGVFGHQAPGVDYIDAGQKITGYAPGTISDEPDYLDVQVVDPDSPNIDIRIANIPPKATYALSAENGVGSIRVGSGEAYIWEHSDMQRVPELAWTPKPGPMQPNGKFDGGLCVAPGARPILRNPNETPALIVATNLGFDRI